MRSFLAALTLAGLSLAAPVTAQDNPVVIELFTSQGCSSCPPADAMLHDLSKRDNVIALALHVDYWDYIGWKDVFGRPENTARQYAYAHTANATTLYTPQMVIGGVTHVVGSRPMQVMDAVQAHAQQAATFDVVLTKRGDILSISAGPGAVGDYVLQLVRFTPEETVAIARGENAGRTLRYTNIVKSWDVIAQWNGDSALAVETAVAGNDAVAVILQQGESGPIVGAAQLR